MKLWKYDYEQRIARLVDCPNGKWPAKDVEGDPVCVNTHFDSEDDAWEKLIREYEAGLELGVRARKDLTFKLEVATKQLADDAQGLVEAKANHAKRLRERGDA